MPEPLRAPPRPEDVNTVEELYLHGLRLDQFHNAPIPSYPYYYEALNRDPLDYRVNTQLGILYATRKMFEEAEKHLQAAVERITMRYTRPKNSDAFYYLGVVQRRLHKNEEAYNNFYAASWNTGWHTPAFHQLAELDCLSGEYEKAFDHINRAISTNTGNFKALGLEVTILRKLGRLEEAEKLATAIILAAGKGSKIWPYATIRPKPLIPVSNKPIISFLVDQLRSVGVDLNSIAACEHYQQYANYFRHHPYVEIINVIKT